MIRQCLLLSVRSWGKPASTGGAIVPSEHTFWRGGLPEVLAMTPRPIWSKSALINSGDDSCGPLLVCGVARKNFCKDRLFVPDPAKLEKDLHDKQQDCPH